MSDPRSRLLPIAALLVATVPAFATSYVMVPDAALADQAALVADARVLSVAPAASARPATDYTVEIERLLAGSAPGSTVVVRVPGGTGPNGLSFRVYGAPRFETGERAILFLAPRRDGTYGILHLALGAFHRVETAREPVAVRDLAGATEVMLPGTTPDPHRHQARDYDAFAAWLADRAAGIERGADYFLPAAAEPISSIERRFTLEEFGGVHLRWFAFDGGSSIGFLANSAGQPGVAGGGFTEFQTALGAWNADACTPVSYTYSGTTAATGGLASFDGLNVLLQDDPNDEISGTFQCATGGVLAIGGPWFDSSARQSWESEDYIPIGGADIVMNDGIECLAASSLCFATVVEGIYAHELGHTLGLGHSCGDASSPSCASDPALDEALMRATAHLDCSGPSSGASLAADDLAGLGRLYDDGSACTGDLHLDLSSQTVTTAETFEACRTITAGSGFVVGATGDVTLRAGERIALADGFASEPGAHLAVEVDPSLRCQ